MGRKLSVKKIGISSFTNKKALGNRTEGFFDLTRTLGSHQTRRIVNGLLRKDIPDIKLQKRDALVSVKSNFNAAF